MYGRSHADVLVNYDTLLPTHVHVARNKLSATGATGAHRAGIEQLLGICLALQVIQHVE